MNKIDPRNIYDDLHQIPELGFEEFKTSAYLADKLEAMGYKVTRNIGGTGVIGEIKGSEAGPVMMLRADMDALPFLIDGEKKNIHACGHDAHSAMLLAAASELVGKVKRGTLRILFAAFCSVIGKLFRRKGWFYIVAGPKARGIDGPTEGTIPPYDHYVVLTPADPMGTSKKLAQALGHPVAIVDINDLGANILGFSEKEPSMDQIAKILGDNPLGQSSESTPMGIIRKA